MDAFAVPLDKPAHYRRSTQIRREDKRVTRRAASDDQDRFEAESEQFDGEDGEGEDWSWLDGDGEDAEGDDDYYERDSLFKGLKARMRIKRVHRAAV